MDPRPSVPGVEVVPVALFDVLDSKRSEDYVQRVEPSARGGEKMAAALNDPARRRARRLNNQSRLRTRIILKTSHPLSPLLSSLSLSLSLVDAAFLRLHFAAAAFSFSSFFALLAAILRAHAFFATLPTRSEAVGDRIRFPFASTSAGNAAAVFVNTFNTVNARIGDRSIVPPMGGMIPRNKFRYGSHSVASGYTICLGGLGNHVRMRRPMSSGRTDGVVDGVRSGVERRRGRGLNAARGGWRDAPGKSLRNGVHHADAVVWGPDAPEEPARDDLLDRGVARDHRRETRAVTQRVVRARERDGRDGRDRG
eukprot:30972-Pelagococcus_subviridis.AAC.1